ncbi:MAG: hypothetical protein ACREFO_15560 [Acetobacteraceae bacterium]
MNFNAIAIKARSPALAVALLGYTVAAQTCNYLPVKPGSGKFNTGEVTVDLGQADDPTHPGAWQGPIIITQADGASCTVAPEGGIVEQPIYHDGRHFLVTTYSGSNRVVYAIDAKSCRVLWHSHPFAGEARLHGNDLQIGKDAVTLDAECVPDSK